MELLIAFLNDFFEGVGSVGVGVFSHAVGLDDCTAGGCRAGACLIAGADAEIIGTGGCREECCPEECCCEWCCC
jgi:hypothetical protein